jgi:hypothetical protein
MLNSKIVTAMIMIVGNNEKSCKIIELFSLKSIIQTKPTSIFNNACPLHRLANNRIDKLKTLAKYDKLSIITKKGAVINGAPEGKKNSIKVILCLRKPNILIAKKKENARPNVTII